MITISGIASAAPICVQCPNTSDCAMPMMVAPTSVHPNERKRPSSAAASAGITRSGIVPARTPVSGETSAPAAPAIAPPITQLTVARRFGDQPSVAAARSFSAAADVASPTRVHFMYAARITVRPAAMP